MAFKCSCCEELYDGDPYETALDSFSLKLDPTSPTGVVFTNTDYVDVCEDCFDDNDIVLVCDITGANFLVNVIDYVHLNRPDSGDYALLEAAELLNYEWHEDDDGCEYYTKPERSSANKITANKVTEQTMALFKDFYYRLNGAERQLVLMKDDGDEEPVDLVHTKKIMSRITADGGNPGDPDVLNTYTRIYAIEKGWLDESYRL